MDHLKLPSFPYIATGIPGWGGTPWETNEWQLENQPFEDVSPIKNDDFSLPC